jgi:hypothetical protein
MCPKNGTYYSIMIPYAKQTVNFEQPPLSCHDPHSPHKKNNEKKRK